MKAWSVYGYLKHVSTSYSVTLTVQTLSGKTLNVLEFDHDGGEGTWFIDLYFSTCEKALVLLNFQCRRVVLMWIWLETGGFLTLVATEHISQGLHASSPLACSRSVRHWTSADSIGGVGLIFLFRDPLLIGFGGGFTRDRFWKFGCNKLISCLFNCLWLNPQMAGIFSVRLWSLYFW